MDDWTAIEWIVVIVISLAVFLLAFFKRDKIKNMFRGGGKGGDKSKKRY